MKKVLNIIIHLRIPFSFFLLPVYLFALAISPNISEDNIILTFLLLHFLIYPASNAYNSYFDKDEESIGLIKKPPPVSLSLYVTSILIEFVGIALAWLISMEFAVMVFIYGLASKAYSHPGIRLKKRPVIGWFIAGFFQGLFTFFMVYVGINDFSIALSLKWKVIFPGLLTSLFLWGSYPMTQIYQHREDAKRGDKTLSLLLGKRGTFIFTLISFVIATLGFQLYFLQYFSQHMALAFLLFLAPTAVFFLIWFALFNRNEKYANYKYTMVLNFLSAVCLNAFFLYLFLKSSNLYQLNL